MNANALLPTAPESNKRSDNKNLESSGYANYLRRLLIMFTKSHRRCYVATSSIEFVDTLNQAASSPAYIPVIPNPNLKYFNDSLTTYSDDIRENILTGDGDGASHNHHDNP